MPSESKARRKPAATPPTPKRAGGTSLAARLGITATSAVQRIALPPTVAAALGKSGRDAATASGIPPDIIVCAVSDSADIVRHAPGVAQAYRAGGRLWMLYPKRAGRIRTDISRDHGWQPLLERGFVPVAQLAVNEDWSALRFRLAAEVRSLTRKTAIGAGVPRR